MRYQVMSAAMSAAPLLAALLLTGCGAGGGLEKPAATLDKAAVARVANVVKQGGDYGTAERIQAAYATAHPGDAAAQISAGNATLQAGDVDKALENFQRAVQLAPGRVD